MQPPLFSMKMEAAAYSETSIRVSSLLLPTFTHFSNSDSFSLMRFGAF
jgi:hypothetical protein